MLHPYLARRFFKTNATAVRCGFLQLFGAGFPGPAALQGYGAARAGGADGADRAVHGQDGGEKVAEGAVKTSENSVNCDFSRKWKESNQFEWVNFTVKSRKMIR